MTEIGVQRFHFLGYPVDNLTIQDALCWIFNATRSSAGRTIAVTNANKLWQAHRDPVLSNFLRSADLIVPEYAVVWGAGKIGVPLQHIGGITLLKAFLPFAEANGIRPYFLGAKPAVVNRMVQKIGADHPSLQIAGFHHGYLDNTGTKQEVIHDLKQKSPDVLFIAMGSPKQELLIEELKRELPIRVFMGVGGSFDVLSGDKRDAPAWARAKGFEWIYRISQDPANTAYWKRYLKTNIWFVYQVLKNFQNHSK